MPSNSWVSSAPTGAAATRQKRTLDKSYFFVAGCCTASCRRVADGMCYHVLCRKGWPAVEQSCEASWWRCVQRRQACLHEMCDAVSLDATQEVLIVEFLSYHGGHLQRKSRSEQTRDGDEWKLTAAYKVKCSYRESMCVYNTHWRYLH